MASSSSLSFSPFLLALTVSIFISLVLPTHSALTCATQKLSSKHTFTNCTDLKSLGATLHYTYNGTNRAISVAFSATPPPSGWVSWGVNPSGGGMAGTQALVAGKLNGTFGVYLYNLISYRSIEPAKNLSVATSAVSGEESSGVITIFATVILPEKADNFTQVWQVGPIVDGKLGKHGDLPDNLNAVEKLSVLTTTIGAANSTSGGGNSTTPAPSTTGDKSGGVSLVVSGFGYYFGFVLLFLSLITM